MTTIIVALLIMALALWLADWSQVTRRVSFVQAVAYGISLGMFAGALRVLFEVVFP